MNERAQRKIELRVRDESFWAKSVIVKTHFQWLVMQEHHFSLLQRETEKLRGDIEKMRSEMRSAPRSINQKYSSNWINLISTFTNISSMSSIICYRYEIDKVTAGQRLDLNLERG